MYVVIICEKSRNVLICFYSIMVDTWCHFVIMKNMIFFKLKKKNMINVQIWDFYVHVYI